MRGVENTDALHQRTNIHILFFKDKDARFHLGKIENVIDDPAQPFARRFGVVQQLQFARVFLIHRQKVDHPQKPAQRGADFVAHGGDETATRSRGRFGAFQGLLKLFGAFLDGAFEIGRLGTKCRIRLEKLATFVFEQLFGLGACELFALVAAAGNTVLWRCRHITTPYSAKVISKFVTCVLTGSA